MHDLVQEVSMFRLTWGLMLGLFLLLAGLSVLAKEVFGVEIPVFRLAFALLLLYAGVSLLAGTAGYRTPRPWDEVVVFGVTELDVSGRDEATVLFGQGTVDLSSVQPPRKLTLNVIFGDAQLRYAPDTPLRIVSNTAFGATELPGGQTLPFGERQWTSPAWLADQPAIELTTNVVFGHLALRPQEGPLTLTPRTPDP
jgi:hypothetical protein